MSKIFRKMSGRMVFALGVSVILLSALLLAYAISKNREIQFWPNPRIAPALSCAANACVKIDGSCGRVEIWGGATRNRQQHGWDVIVVSPAPNEKHYSEKLTDAGLQVGVAWQCI